MPYHRSVLPEPIDRYVRTAGARETGVQRRLREETARLREAGMQIGADEANLLALVVRMIGARRAIEVGTFTGYSALAVASALPPEGRLVCCDINREWTDLARRYWREAGVADRIDLRLAPALDTLRDLARDPGPGAFDFMFIDADKSGYDAYYEHALVLLRAGGVVAIDNTLWSGWVADPSHDDEDTHALRALNEKVQCDERVDMCLLSVGDGVTLARKR
jgi:predicted O-methyltransferase YrrM